MGLRCVESGVQGKGGLAAAPYPNLLPASWRCVCALVLRFSVGIGCCTMPTALQPAISRGVRDQPFWGRGTRCPELRAELEHHFSRNKHLLIH